MYDATALTGVTITAQDPYANTRHLYQDDKGYGPATSPMPDYVSLTVSGTAIVGGGAGVDGTIGYVKGDGAFVNSSVRVGSGADVSVGLTLTVGYYTGTDKPTQLSVVFPKNEKDVILSLQLRIPKKERMRKVKPGKYRALLL